MNFRASTRRWLLLAALTGALSLGACVGDIGDGSIASPDAPSEQTLNEIGESGMRRLSAAEYNATVFDLLGVVVDGSSVLPQDVRRPYDNEYATQQASEALINSVDSLSGDIAAAVLADTTLRDKMMPCQPSGPNDEACYRAFVAKFGRLALRRPLTTEEIDRFGAFMAHATEADDFWVAIDSALRAFLQHPEFLYRIEIGTPVAGQPGVFRLTDYQLATRLSYLLWGSTPPPWLLDAAEAGELATPEGARANAMKLLADDIALERIARFHSMWLGYEALPFAPDLAADLKLETTSLIDRVMFKDEGPWLDLLRSQETFLTPALAQHYGLPEPAGGEAGWVSYGDSGRQGLLSQGSFLSAVSKFGDTSPTQRGLLIRRFLFCETINRPDPSLNVNVDEPPGDDPNACKIDRYNMWQREGCKGCHLSMDPVGFGLERYDASGRYREFQPDRPDCPIDGNGVMAGVGDFNGPAELSDLVAQNPDINACVATQLYRFTMGRSGLKSNDKNLLKRLVEVASVDGELHLQTLIAELAGSDAFRHRREEKVQ